MEFKELEEFQEEFWKSSFSRMDLFLADKVKKLQQENERLTIKLSLNSNALKREMEKNDDVPAHVKNYNKHQTKFESKGDSKIRAWF